VGLSQYVEGILDDPSRLPGFVTESAAADPASVPDTPAVATDEGGADALQPGRADAIAAEDVAPAGVVPAEVAPVAAADPEATAKAEPPEVEAAKPAARARKAPRLARKEQPKARAKKERRTVSKRKKSPKPEPAGKPVLAEPAGPAPKGDATDLYYAGLQQLRSGNFNAAIASLSASQRQRSSSRTLAKLGQAYFDAGKLTHAEKTLRAAGRRPEAMLLLATLYQQTSRVDRTRKTYQAFLTHHPDHSRAAWVRKILKRL